MMLLSVVGLGRPKAGVALWRRPVPGDCDPLRGLQCGGLHQHGVRPCIPHLLRAPVSLHSVTGLSSPLGNSSQP